MMTSPIVVIFAIAALASVDCEDDQKEICLKQSDAVKALNKKKIIPTHDKASFTTDGLTFKGSPSLSPKTCTDDSKTFIETTIPTYDAKDASKSKALQTTVKIQLGRKDPPSGSKYVLTARPTYGAFCDVTVTPSGSIELKDICNEESANWKKFMESVESVLIGVQINSKVYSS